MRSERLQDKDPFYKDRSDLKEGDSARTQHKSDRGVLKDYSLKHKVTMHWDLNEDAARNRMFKLRVDDYEVVLDWEEVLRTGRFI